MIDSDDEFTIDMGNGVVNLSTIELILEVLGTHRTVWIVNCGGTTSLLELGAKLRSLVP